MTKYVARIKRSLLHNSKFIAARRMTNSDKGYKYLTENQVSQVLRYGLSVEYLPEAKVVNKAARNKKRKVTVKFKDEEGTHSTEFDDKSEAEKWVSFQESCTEEKFELISIE